MAGTYVLLQSLTPHPSPSTANMSRRYGADAFNARFQDLEGRAAFTMCVGIQLIFFHPLTTRLLDHP